MPFVLRDYQNDIIARARGYLKRGCRRLLIQAPTGSGKTVLIAHMLDRAAARGNRSIFGVHRRELIKQSVRTFEESNVRVGVIAAGWDPDPSLPIQIASIPTLTRRLGSVPGPTMMVTDECHHVAAKSWARIHEHFSEAVHIGLTATPCRLDGKGLDRYFDDMIVGPSVPWLIENGFLSRFRMFAPGGGFNMEGVHTRMGDYVRAEMLERMDKPKITGDAVTHYLKLCPGRRAVAFCPSIEYSRALVEAFRGAGVASEHVDGDTQTQDRDAAVNRFSAGETLVLSNVELFGEGFDLPAIEAAICLRPTKSIGLYLQQVGRALRTAEKKDEAVILDHAGNCKQHGFPDEERGWSLVGGASTSRSTDSGNPVRICPHCYACLPAQRRACSQCGYEFPVQARKVEQVDGDLTEVKRERQRQAFEVHRARTRETLIAVARHRGYKNPEYWADMILQGRRRKREQMALAYGRLYRG